VTKVSREHIIDAAIILFREHGYHGTSMRDIARAVGIKKASLYHHFESKQELLLTILDTGLERLIAPLEEILAAKMPPEAKLRAAIHHHASLIANYPGAAALFLYEDRALDEAYRARYVARRDEFESLFRQILQEGVHSGSFRQTDLAMSTQALLGMVNWMTRWYRPQGRLSVEEIADSFADLFLCGQLASKDEAEHRPKLKSSDSRVK
jgi:AcrR family transcriptional regulator